jgi:hypothetical protein
MHSKTCLNHAHLSKFPYHRYHHYLVAFFHQTYRHRGKIHNMFASKYFILLCIFVSTHLLIVYPSQTALDNPTTQFVNNLFNSSGGGSNDGNPYV